LLRFRIVPKTEEHKQKEYGYFFHFRLLL
jgi:hypothetical protein